MPNRYPLAGASARGCQPTIASVIAGRSWDGPPVDVSIVGGVVRHFACLLLLWVASVAWGQRHALDEPRLTAVGDTQSINDGVVTALAEDEAGLLWIGTTTGVVRHDGP